MIDFGKAFGANSQSNTGSASNNNSRADQPKAKFWLNIGYAVPADPSIEDDSDRFVSLPLGIPLDTQEPVKLTGRNADYIAFTSARSDLLAQMQQYADTLEPGQDAILNLQIQLRRVNNDTAPAAPTENRFSRSFDLKG